MQRDQLGDLAAFVSPARRGASPRRLSDERLLRTLRPALEEIDGELAALSETA